MPEKLGQNFLNNPEIVKKIIEAAEIDHDDFVLEIGPGKGILTQELIKKSGKVVAVEIDEKLVKSLKEKFRNTKNLEIIQENILATNLDTLYQTLDTNYKLIANIPYYITSKIIRKFLESQFPPQKIILMVQKEVAERIVAKPGKMSLLAVSVQFYAKPQILFKVIKDNFSPMPEVDSAVIKITPQEPKTSPEENKKFFQIARIGFSSKRKTLLNNLSNGLHQEKEIVLGKLEELGFSQNTRAQELSVFDWEKLAKLF